MNCVCYRRFRSMANMTVDDDEDIWRESGCVHALLVHPQCRRNTGVPRDLRDAGRRAASDTRISSATVIHEDTIEGPPAARTVPLYPSADDG